MAKDLNDLLAVLAKKVVTAVPPEAKKGWKLLPVDTGPMTNPVVEGDGVHKGIEDDAKVLADATKAAHIAAEQAKFDADNSYKKKSFTEAMYKRALKESLTTALEQRNDKQLSDASAKAKQLIKQARDNDALPADKQVGFARNMKPISRALDNETEHKALPQEWIDQTVQQRKDELATLKGQSLVQGGAAKKTTPLFGRKAGDAAGPGALGNKSAPTYDDAPTAKLLKNQLEHTYDPTLAESAQNKKKGDYFHEDNFPERQKAIAELAKKADPFMRRLQKDDTLAATHYDAIEARKKAKKGEAGFAYHGDAVEKDGEAVYGLGMASFGNRERIVPDLPVHGDLAVKDNGADSRENFWSEADVDRLTKNKRNEDRLLHTSAKTKVDKQDSVLYGATPEQRDIGDKKEGDNRFWVTGDHYKSAVSVSPVSETTYKDTDEYKNNPDRKKYADPAGAQNSLAYQDALEQKRRDEEAKSIDALENPTRNTENFGRARNLTSDPPPAPKAP